MPDFITLSCPSCGAKLQLAREVDRFACASCKNEFLVRRGGGIVTLAPILEGLSGIKASADRAAAELAVRRLTEEIDGMEREYNQIASRHAGMFRYYSVLIALALSGLLTILLAKGIWSMLLGMGLLLLGTAAFFFVYYVRKGLKDDCDKLLNQARKKNLELKKHKAYLSNP